MNGSLSNPNPLDSTCIQIGSLYSCESVFQVINNHGLKALMDDIGFENKRVERYISDGKLHHFIIVYESSYRIRELFIGTLKNGRLHGKKNLYLKCTLTSAPSGIHIVKDYKIMEANFKT